MKAYNRQRSEKMANLFASNVRPIEFEECFELCSFACGQYKQEAQAIWNAIKEIKPMKMAEVGRDLGGNSFLMCCAAPKLEHFTSIDINYDRSLTDNALRFWLDHHKVQHQILVRNSATYSPQLYYDFVYIDGGHEYEDVVKDIEVWRTRTRYIGFHDFADLGSKNKHKRAYPGVVKAIKEARDHYGWREFGTRADGWVRGRSEIIFKVL